MLCLADCRRRAVDPHDLRARRVEALRHAESHPTVTADLDSNLRDDRDGAVEAEFRLDPHLHLKAVAGDRRFRLNELPRALEVEVQAVLLFLS